MWDGKTPTPLGRVDNHFNENINTSYKNMALCTYEKFSTIKPALLKNAVKKADGRKLVKMLFITAF